MGNAALSSKRFSETRTRDWIKVVIATAVAVASAWVCFRLEANDQRTLAATIASMAGSMLGFVVAVISILLAMNDRAVIQNMRRTGHFDVLVDEFGTAGVIYTASLALSLAAVLMKTIELEWPTAVGTGLFCSGSVIFVAGARKLWLIILVAHRTVTTPPEKKT